VEKSSLETAKNLEVQVAVAYDAVQSTSAEFAKKEASWEQQTMVKVTKAREEEQDQKERAVAVEKKKAAKAMTKKETEYDAMLRQKIAIYLSCHLWQCIIHFALYDFQVVSKVASQSRSLVATLQQEKAAAMS
jgi:uncharacterized radical SAM superfamily Fe-S cluster-containing enzyme